MKSAISFAVAALLGCTLAACDSADSKLAAAEPATGDQLRAFSREWNDPADLIKNASLLQRLCRNASGAACAPDTIERLKQSGLNNESTNADLAYTFVLMTADAKDGAADQQASDQNFVDASYHVMFGRAPDPEGAAHHLGTIQGKGEEARRTMATTFLRSPEFNSQK